VHRLQLCREKNSGVGKSARSVPDDREPCEHVETSLRRLFVRVRFFIGGLFESEQLRFELRAAWLVPERK
jgi:hypothetical protein